MEKTRSESQAAERKKKGVMSLFVFFALGIKVWYRTINTKDI